MKLEASHEITTSYRYSCVVSCYFLSKYVMVAIVRRLSCAPTTRLPYHSVQLGISWAVLSIVYIPLPSQCISLLGHTCDRATPLFLSILFFGVELLLSPLL